MAKTITDEQMKLNIIINGNEAQKQLFELEKATKSLNAQNTELRKEKQLLEKQGLKDTERYKAVTASLKENSKAITDNKTQMSNLQKELGLTGLTMNQLQSKAIGLRMTLKNLIPGSEDYKKYKAELESVTQRINEVNGRAQQAGFSISRFADGFNKYAALGASAIAAGTGIVLSLQKMIDFNAKLSDAQANVQKTTGMTRDEVDALTKSFGMMQTRTSRIDLLGIAETGGRLGIAKAEIEDFVKVMDKSAVALGDSFEGGPEVVAEKLGKIKGLFQETKDVGVEVAFESIGSALNDLGAAGTASEANVADFVTRIGTMPEALKPSIATALGLGAAFEESGINAEKGATNYSKVITLAAKSTGDFAKVMGMSKKQVDDLINTNPNEFFLKFSESLKGLSGTEMAQVLDKLKLNDNEVKQVISAASQNTDMFRQKIDLANNSLNQGTSLTNEFNIKNSTLAATLEKVQKRIIGAFSSEAVVNWLEGVVNWFAKVIGAIDETDRKTKVWQNTLLFLVKAIAVLTAALITNVAWQKLATLWTTRNTEATLLYNLGVKARAFTEGVSMVASQAYAAVTMLLTGNIRGATQAIRVMATTMMTTPWGLILSLVSAVAVAYIAFSDNAKEAVTAQSILAENTKLMNSEVAKQTTELNNLLAVAKDETASKYARLAAIKRLNEISPEYLGNLTLENINTMQGKAAIDAYVASLERKIMLQILEDKQRKLKEAIYEKDNQKLEEEVDYWDKLVAGVKNFGSVYGSGVDLFDKATKRRKLSLSELQKQLDFTNAEMKKFLEANPSVLKNTTTSTAGAVVPEEDVKTGKALKSQQELERLRIESQLKYNDQSAALARQLEDEKINAMEDGYQKQIAIENLRYKREIEDLQRKKIHTDEMAKIDEEIQKASVDGDLRYRNFLLLQKQEWIKRNQAIDNQINQIEQEKAYIHKLKLQDIEEKAFEDKIKRMNTEFEQMAMVRETAYYNELAAAGNNAQKRNENTKRFDAQELEEKKNHLKALIKQLQDSLIIENNFSILPNAVKDKLYEDINKAINALAKLEAALPNSKPGQEIDLGVGAPDILGYSKQQWDNFFTNIDKGTIGFQTMSMAMNLASQAFTQLDQSMTASENAQLKSYERYNTKRKAKLLEQLNHGYINQVQYKKAVEKVDEDLDRKKQEIEISQAKRQRALAIMSIISNTAAAIMGIWKDVPKFDFGSSAFALSLMVGALGAVQLATVANTEIPGYEQGLYPEYVTRQQDNKKFKAKFRGNTQSGMVNDASYFLAAENGPEMIIDNKAWAQISPETKQALIREIKGIKGFENGYYKDNVLYSGATPTQTNDTPVQQDTQIMQAMMVLIAENTKAVKDLQENGVMAVVTNRDLKGMKYLQEGIDKYNELRNKSKK